jgi:transposase
MPKHRTLDLSEQQREELRRYRDHDQRPYLRERAAALLKLADGEKAAEVARRLLLRRHKPDTIYAWHDRYDQEGITGLLIRKGRGRKPAFSPSAGR